jgi:S-adenosylhomocysteine hydrolase
VFGDNLQVFAKPKSVDKNILKILKTEGIDIVLARRTDNFEKYITGKTVLMDIGGYFTRIAQKKGLPIIGIIEDTENGLQKYDNIKKEVKYPVVSVARSELKNNEDKLVGEAVAHAVDTILRQGNIVIDYCRCGIIGYGKVGAGIAKGLLKRGVKPYVVEKNPVRLVKAINDYCYAADIDYLASSSKVIFSATGSVALSADVLRKVRNGAYIASVTSSDSEFDIPSLENEYQAIKISDYITKYINEHNFFYLLNGGNAVNFLYNAALGSFIYLVLGEELTVLGSFVGKNKYKIGVNFSQENIADIAAAWLREFITLNPRV